jgi:hypothetical protein
MNVKEISVDLEKDIEVNIKPKYGSLGKIICNIMDINGDTKEIFSYDLTEIKKNKKFIISKNDFNNTNKKFICFYIKLTPMPGKSKKEIDIILYQEGKKVKKISQKETISTSIFRIL